MHYTGQRDCSITRADAVSMHCPHTLHTNTSVIKMPVITRVTFHEVDVILHVKLHTVVQLELINSV